MLKNHDENLKKLQGNIVYFKSHNDKIVYIYNKEDIENNFVCLYPERLLREHLQDIPCKSSTVIYGYWP